MSRQEGKTLYLECNSGISGDMMVAALIDLGADTEVLNRALHSLSVSGFETEITRVKKAGLDVCDFRVILDARHENHDHDMAYLHGTANLYKHTHLHEEAHDHTHSHEEANSHVHSHGEAHSHTHNHDHEHRGISDILAIIEDADITTRAKEIAVRIFEILAEAEAKAHGVTLDQVHFHEVGAVDSIVDIVAVAVCLDNLAVEKCVVPMLCEGRGTVRCQHGVLPVPVPAVANIVQMHGLKLSIMDMQGEFVTPTGAAIVAAIQTSDSLPSDFFVAKIGMGGGKREYERPSILRAMLIEENSEKKDSVWKLESNIDDCSGEALGYAMERLFEAGARDVHYMPVYMKKNRPGYQLNVICSEEDVPKMEQIIFEETTTIGIRKLRYERSVLKRRQETVITSLGEAKVKVCTIGSEIRKYPEYNSVIALCKKYGKSYQEVYSLIVRECNDNRKYNS